MKFNTAFALLASVSTVVATPAPVYLGDGVTLTPRESRSIARRAARNSRPRLDVDGSLHSESSGTAHVSYSSNWAGAVLVGSGYKAVTGTIVVPTPKVPSGGKATTTYSASAWVGIDGDTCSTSILQTGLDFNVKNGAVSFDAWYEWFPDYAYTFTGFAIKAGDSIKMTASATTTSAGSVTIQNLSTGKTVTHSFTAQTAKLCETNAEWIVEDFEQNNALVPFANFGTVTFTGVSVTTSSGTIGASGATIIDLKQGTKVYTDCSASSSSVSCTYSG